MPILDAVDTVAIMLIGYARVSTQDQNLELQREALNKAGCKKVFEDKASGTRSERPALIKTLEILREGDTLVVWRLDRLGRSVKQLVDLVGELHKQGIQFKSLTDAIDIRFLRGPLLQPQKGVCLFVQLSGYR
jgi:DNA invertase Pin-like site-specific DNA recombinase